MSKLKENKERDEKATVFASRPLIGSTRVDKEEWFSSLEDFGHNGKICGYCQWKKKDGIYMPDDFGSGLITSAICMAKTGVLRNKWIDYHHTHDSN